jgi:hypothetical protein
MEEKKDDETNTPTATKKRKSHHEFRKTNWKIECKNTVFHVNKTDIKKSGYLSSLILDKTCEKTEITETDPEVLATVLNWSRSGKVALDEVPASRWAPALALIDRLLFSDLMNGITTELILRTKPKSEDKDIKSVLIDLLKVTSSRKMESLNNQLLRFLFNHLNYYLSSERFDNMKSLPSSILLPLLVARCHSYCSCVHCRNFAS